MRKIFGMATGVAVAGATLFGAVFAWTATGSDSDSANVGVATAVVTVTPNGAVLGPNNGSAVTVGTVSVAAASGSLPLATYDITGVTIDLVTPGTPTSVPACAITDFTTTSSLATGIAIGITSPVSIATNTGAPEDCQGDLVDYTVNVTAYT